MILLGSYVCYTTNTLDAIEAFIAETYVELVTNESMCYSTSCSALLERLLANAPTLYCVVPYVVACVDISIMVLSGPFKWTFEKDSLLTGPSGRFSLSAGLLPVE